MDNIGRKIAELRRAAGMKQDELAERLGVTPQAVSKWENGVSAPDISLLPEIAEIFGVTIDELFARTETPIVQFVPEEKRKSIDELVLRIFIDSDGDHVRVNLPIPLVMAAVKIGMTDSLCQIGNKNISDIDFAKLIMLVENGAIGRLVEVVSDDGTTVVIEVS